MLVHHDIHVHTNLSSCSHDPQATPENYIRRAAELGLQTIGFANHLWDNCIPGSSDWYRPQDAEHILKIKAQLPEDTQGVRVLIGCESEYCGGGKVGISRHVAEQLDYVLLPISHFHMKGFVLPEGVSSIKEVADLLVQRFHEVIDLGIATGIAHPFVPLGFTKHIDEIFAAISDTAFADCFGRAAEAGVSIEIQPSYFPESQGKKSEGHHDASFLRMLSIAKKAGCCFHFGSDAHTLEGLDQMMHLEKCVQELGLEESDIWPGLR